MSCGAEAARCLVVCSAELALPRSCLLPLLLRVSVSECDLHTQSMYETVFLLAGM